MFKIVALVYFLVSGQTIDQPLSLDHQGTFDGLDKCQDALKSAEFAAHRAQLQQLFEIAVLQQHAVAVAKAGPDDEPPVLPTIAITTSCQPDNRV